LNNAQPNARIRIAYKHEKQERHRCRMMDQTGVRFSRQ
jgi:hypothetical protein